MVEAVEEFAAGDLPWNVQLRPGYPAELDGALAERGLVVTAEIPLMVLPDPATLADLVAAPPARFRQVETFADLDSLLSLLERGFGMPPEIARGCSRSGCCSWRDLAGRHRRRRGRVDRSRLRP